MNIINKKDGNRAFFGMANFDSSYGIVSADEKFYRLIDERQCYPFIILHIIHKSHHDKFIDLVNSLASRAIKTDALLFQLKENCYEWMWMILERLEGEAEGKTLYNIRIFKISLLEETIREQKKIIRNYRSIMGLTDNLFFEYDVVTTEILIYWHSGEQDVIEIKMPLNDWKKEVIKNGYVPEQDHKTFFSLCEDLSNERGNFYYSFDNSILTKGREDVHWVIRGSTVHERSKLISIVGTINIQSNEGKSDTYFEERIHVDVLTGLLNKRAITQLAESKINFAGNNRLRLVIMDIDNFKQINDQYGHMAGDDVLLKVSNIFKRMIGNHGVAGRIGGDEFFAVLEDVEDEQDLRNILKAIRINVAWAINDSDRDIMVTCSMGTVEYPTDGHSYEELFQKADYSLYLAKQKGRNRYIIYDKEKHGDVIVDKKTKGVNCLESQKKERDKITTYSHIIQDLYQRGYDAILDSLSLIGQMCNCEKINIYYGEQMNCLIHWGENYPEDETVDYIYEPAYLEYFDENGVCVLDSIYITKTKLAYEHFTKQKLSSTMQVLFGDKTVIRGFLSFDRTMTKARLTSMDRYNLQLISKLIGFIIEKYQLS